MLKLWVLRANESSDHWMPWYDKAFGFVVRAATEEAARGIAAANGGDEIFFRYTSEPKNPWLMPEHSTCKLLTEDGEEGVILRDFASA